METDLLALVGMRWKNYVDSIYCKNCIDDRQVLLIFTEVIDDLINNRCGYQWGIVDCNNQY